MRAGGPAVWLITVQGNQKGKARGSFLNGQPKAQEPVEQSQDENLCLDPGL